MPLPNDATLEQVVTALQNMTGINQTTELAAAITLKGIPATANEPMQSLVNKVLQLAGKGDKLSGDKYKRLMSIAVHKQNLNLHKLAMSPDQNIVLINNTNVLRKVKLDGSPIWETPLPVSSNPNNVTVDSLNNIYVSCGDYYIRKYSSGGVLLWTSSTIYNGVVGMATDSQNNVYIASNNSPYLSRIDSNGALKWSNGSPYQLASMTIVGDMIYAGQLMGNWARVNLNGAQQLTGGTRLRSVEGITADAEGNVYFAGIHDTSNSTLSGNECITKVSSTGAQMGAYQFDFKTQESNTINALIMMPNGELAVSTSIGLIVRMTTNGIMSGYFPGTATEWRVPGLAADKESNIYGATPNGIKAIKTEIELI